MTGAKTTKRSLFTSIVALLLCFSMLLGTTFAWFTDSVTSNNNIIKSGTLEIAFEYYDGSEWLTVEGASDILTGNLWEPGYVDVAYLRIKNVGSLALKYKLGVNIVAETSGKNVKGEDLTLSNYIYYDVETLTVNESAPFAPYADRETALSKVSTPELISKAYTNEFEPLLESSDYVYLAMIVYMPESVGNEANHDGENIPEIKLGITINATQTAYEKDSFDEMYDFNIGLASTYADIIQAKGTSGDHILTADLKVEDKIYFGDNTDNSIDLNGKNITTTSSYVFATQGENCNLTINGEGNVSTETGYAALANKGSTLTVNGGTYQLGDITQAAHFYTQNSATTVINDGTFISEDPNTPILYCINGFIEINGGFFQNTANPNQALLSMGNNLKYANNQKITLSGGTFVNWNPMSSAFAKPWTNPDVPALIILAEGYEIVSETQANGDVWYCVVPIQS